MVSEAYWPVVCNTLSMILKTLSLMSFLSTLAACSTPPIRSTVDGYGEGDLNKTDAFYFDREGLPLLEKPISDSCRMAANEAGLKTVDTACPACRRVEVHARIESAQQKIRSSPSVGTSVGFFGGYSGLGLGFGSGNNVRSEDQAARVIEVNIFVGDAKKPMRSIVARSIGRDNSVAAVAHEMCTAAFQDFPQNISGKVYDVDAK